MASRRALRWLDLAIRRYLAGNVAAAAACLERAAASAGPGQVVPIDCGPFVAVVLVRPPAAEAEPVGPVALHEVNQPLMSMAAAAGACLRWIERDEPPLDRVRQALLDIVAQSQRAGRIVHALQADAQRAADPADQSRG
jgi:hypothetical protein